MKINCLDFWVFYGKYKINDYNIEKSFYTDPRNTSFDLFYHLEYANNHIKYSYNHFCSLGSVFFSFIETRNLALARQRTDTSIFKKLPSLALVMYWATSFFSIRPSIHLFQFPVFIIAHKMHLGNTEQESNTTYLLSNIEICCLVTQPSSVWQPCLKVMRFQGSPVNQRELKKWHMNKQQKTRGKNWQLLGVKAPGERTVNLLLLLLLSCPLPLTSLQSYIAVLWWI